MTTDDHDQRLKLLPRPDRRRFATGTLRLAPGETLPFQPAWWHDALVVVERGQLELLCSHGDRHRFNHGAVLCLDGLPVSLLENPGPVDAVVIAVRRKSRAEPINVHPGLALRRESSKRA